VNRGEGKPSQPPTLFS